MYVCICVIYVLAVLARECRHTDMPRSDGRWTSLLQSSIDLCNTTTPNKFHIEQNVHIPMADGPPIEHRSMQHHNTQSVSHIEKCRWTPLQSTIDLCYTITPNTFHI